MNVGNDIEALERALREKNEGRPTFTVAQLAEAVGRSTTTVRRAIWCGQLKAARFGHRKRGPLLIRSRAAAEWLLSLEG